MKLEIKAPAKINLSLKVVGKRPDGYHDIESLMVPIDRFDVITLEEGGDGIRCVCDNASVPTDGKNLCVKAALAFMEEAQDRFSLTISIRKNIPIGAGLGGGSSDAAATLMGLNALRGEPFSMTRMHKMAVNIGSDVPFFLKGRAQWARGRGEILNDCGNLPDWHYVLAYPGFEVSAGWAYSHLPLTMFNENRRIRYFQMEGVLLLNDLERAVLPAYPAVQRLKDALEESGAKYALMSGSGPTVFGIFDDFGIAEKAVRKLSATPANTVFQARKHESETTQHKEDPNGSH